MLNSDRTLRILHIITTIDLGGAENHLFDLVTQQRKLGYEVQIVYLKGDHFWLKKYNEIGVATHCLQIKNYFLLFKFFLLRKLIAKFQPDIVHGHMPPAELVARLALVGNSSLDLIISKHNDEPFAPFFKNQFFANWCAKRARSIICISNAVQNYTTSWLSPRQIGKLRKVYYAVDGEKFANAKPAQDLRMPEHLVFGTVARLTPQKSLPTLLRAFAKFRQVNPASSLIIVGAGELEEKLKRLAEDLNISSNTIWTGKRADVASVIKCMDIFVLPSVYEGFGLVLLEAMAAGVPIIASNVSAIPEVLEQGNCGLLFAAENEEELFKCMNRMQSESLRAEYKSKGLARVKKDFSREKMAFATQEIYLCSLAR